MISVLTAQMGSLIHPKPFRVNQIVFAAARAPTLIAENRYWPEGRAGLAFHFTEPQTSSF